MSCLTLQKEESKEKLTFIPFPDPKSDGISLITYTVEKGVVNVPAIYARKLQNYIVNVEYNKTKCSPYIVWVDLPSIFDEKGNCLISYDVKSDMYFVNIDLWKKFTNYVIDTEANISIYF